MPADRSRNTADGFMIIFKNNRTEGFMYKIDTNDFSLLFEPYIDQTKLREFAKSLFHELCEEY